MESSILSKFELLVLTTVAAGITASCFLTDLGADLSALKRDSRIRQTCWWDTYGDTLTAYDVHTRWGVWPSSLLRVLHLCGVSAANSIHAPDWAMLAKIQEIKEICHALEYLVHGMCNAASGYARILHAMHISHVHVDTTRYFQMIR